MADNYRLTYVMPERAKGGKPGMIWSHPLIWRFEAENNQEAQAKIDKSFGDGIVVDGKVYHFKMLEFAKLECVVILASDTLDSTPVPVPD